MKECIGTQDPIVFFKEMTDVLEVIVNKLNNIEKRLSIISTQSSLGINWDSKIALEIMSSEIEKMRENKDVFSEQLSIFKSAYIENKVTQDYQSFVNFWQEVLGWHPFIDQV